VVPFLAFMAYKQRHAEKKAEVAAFEERRKNC
jgi:hypothetical protein